MKQRVFYTELAYVIGILFIALGVACSARADLGVSMVVAPAYVIYLKLSPIFPIFSFGMAEYLLQFVLLIAMTLILKRFRLSYLFSFITAVIYGFVLDDCMFLIGLIPGDTLAFRIGFYVFGMLSSAFGVSMMFHTYLSPEVYELFVKEVSKRVNMDITRFKTLYDLMSCLVGVLLSFLFFGLFQFEGVKIGTVICALINGPIIGFFSKTMEQHVVFQDRLRLRPMFEA